MKSSWPLGESFCQNALVFSRVRRLISAGTGQKNPMFCFFFLMKISISTQQTTNKQRINEPTKNQQTGPNNEKPHLFGATAQRHCAGYRLREVENSSAPLMTFHLFRVQSDLWILVEKNSHKTGEVKGR